MFALAVDDWSSTIATAHTAGDGQIVLAALNGLPALPAGRIYRVTAMTSPDTLSETILGVFEATGRTGSTLTGVTASAGYTDVNLGTDVTVQIRVCKATIDELQTGIETLGPALNAITALTGDVTASGPGAAAATLATVNSNVGTFTNAGITVDGKGRITAAASGTSSGGLAIGSTITGGTAGRVLFEGAGAVLADASGLAYDATTRQMTLGDDYPNNVGLLTIKMGNTGYNGSGLKLQNQVNGQTVILTNLSNSLYVVDASGAGAPITSGSYGNPLNGSALRGQSGYWWLDPVTPGANRGRLSIGALPPTNEQLGVYVQDAGNFGIKIQLAASQSANAFHVVASNGTTILAAIDKDGVLMMANVRNAINDAAAAALTPPVPLGGVYRNGSVLMIRVT